MHPTLFRRNGRIIAPEKNNRWSFYPIQFVKRRFANIALGIFEGGSSKIIVVEGSAKIGISPVACPIYNAGAGRGRLVSCRGYGQGYRQERSVTPAQRAELICVDQAPVYERFNTLFDIRHLQIIIVPAGYRLDPFPSVVGT